MRIITIACWIITALALTGVAIWFLTGTVFGVRSGKLDSDWGLGINIGGFEVLSGPYEAVGVYTPETSGIDSLDINWVSGEISILPYEGESFRITEFAQRELMENEKLQISISNGTLRIKYCENGRIIRMPPKKLEVLIPQALSESIYRLSADAASSTVSIDNISARIITTNTVSGAIRISNTGSTSLDMDSASGSLTLERIGAQNMKLNTISGAIHITDSSATELVCDTASGSINVSGTFESTGFNSISGRISLDNFAPGSVVKANTSSGAMEINGAFESAKTESISGSITVKSSEIPDILEAETTSGSITVTVPNEGPITVHHSSMSGRFSSDIPIIVQNRNAQFVFSSISGSVRILELE
jgi:DUF4097 and DUF4098 domain-containing protein YvlB